MQSETKILDVSECKTKNLQKNEGIKTKRDEIVQDNEMKEC